MQAVAVVLRCMNMVLVLALEVLALVEEIQQIVVAVVVVLAVAV
jgi:hypothetical protein